MTDSLQIDSGKNWPSSKLADFYESVGSTSKIGLEDQVFVASFEGRIQGLVRLAREEGTLVLRGMFLDPSAQRRGVGTRLLRALEDSLPAERCFCLPYSHLEVFYGQAGFVRTSTTEAPAFLSERLQTYRARHRTAFALYPPPLKNSPYLE